jgi:hypothetical protein
MTHTSSEINKLRQVYSKEILDEKMVNSNPIVQFDLCATILVCKSK